ncbi:MAG TPA: ATP-binding protein, partial [Clostridia bacterium]|nr:ATP-binding protein [Clostridia bacterium]
KESRGKHDINENCYIDFDGKCVVENGEQKKFSRRHMDTLSLLVQNLNHTVSINDIHMKLFGYEYDPRRCDNNLVQIQRLISQLRNNSILSRCIETDDKGYRLTDSFPLPSLKPSYSHKNDNTITPFYNCPFYENRKNMIQKLHKEAFVRCPVHAISGERGMGKTELAKEYANSCITDGYKNIIFTTYSDSGLKDTIISLPCNALNKRDNRYKVIISLLKGLEKPSLLIIDNIDYSNNQDLSELSDKSECYMDLINTGCHILMTSKTNLSNCYAIEQTEIKPLEMDILVQLFFKIMFDIKEKDSDIAQDIIAKKIAEYLMQKHDREYHDFIESITDLIDNRLMRNTYLVTLVAKLSQIKDPYDIIVALASDNTKSLDDTVSVFKDGEHKKDNIINLYYSLFKISGITDTDIDLQLLYNLALLPISGFNYDTFFDNSFDMENREQLKAAFDKLLNGYYAFNHYGTISIHPFIREIILTKIDRFDFNYIEKYVSYITDIIDNATYDSDLTNNLTLATSLYSGLKKIGQIPLSYAKLTACIANVYRIITNNQLGYKYGKHAIELLDSLDMDALSEDDKLEKASCLNQAGYAVLQYTSAKDRLSIAYKAISCAEQITESIKNKLNQPESISNKCDRLLTVINGNLGAYHYASRDYIKALDYHKKTKVYREALVQSEPNSVNLNLLATAYRNIGSDYFHISRSCMDEEKYNYLKLSYENQLISASIFEKVNTAQHIETIISNNRLIGAGIMLTNLYFDLCEQKKDVTPPFESIKDSLAFFSDKIKAGIIYMHDVGVFTKEVEDSIGKTRDLLSILENRNIVDKSILTNITETIDVAASIPGIDMSFISICYDMIDKVTEMSMIKIRETSSNE